MQYSTSRQTTLTLFLSIALALTLLSSPVAADVNAHHRILRKRAAPTTSLQPLLGAGDATVATGTTATTSPAVKTTEATTTTSPLIALPTLSNILSVPSSSSAASSSASVSSSSASSSASASSSSASSSVVTSTSASSSAPAPTSSAAQLSTQVVQGITTLTTAVASSATTGISDASASGNATMKKPSTIAITILIGISASGGGLFILFVLVKKWQASRAKPDARMQPISWQPTEFDDGNLPGDARRHSGASFQSQSQHAHGSNDGHSAHGHGARSLAPLDHDFTAGGPGQGVGGYADLARGGPQPPQMQEAGPGLPTAYDNHVPLHHQQGTAYGADGVTPLNFRY